MILRMGFTLDMGTKQQCGSGLNTRMTDEHQETPVVMD